MQLLASSTDFEDLALLIKRMVRAHIPSAVSKDPGNGQLGIWVQQDCDFPLALRVASTPPRQRRLPDWAVVYSD